MEDKKYIELLNSIAKNYLPAKFSDNPEKIFTLGNESAVINDLKHIKGKNYSNLDNQDNLIALGKDAFEWNKFLLKKKYNIDVDADVKEGKYSEEYAFAATIIYGHKGAKDYLTGNKKASEALVKILSSDVLENSVSTIVVKEGEERLVNLTDPKPQVIDRIEPITPKLNIEITAPELIKIPQVEITPVEKVLSRKEEKELEEKTQEKAYNAYKKIEDEKTPFILKMNLAKAYGLNEHNHDKMHSCFEDAEFFNRKFGFISSFADPIEDVKHPMGELLNESFSLAHHGFKKQNGELQISGFGAGESEESHHHHKEFHLDQAYINRGNFSVSPIDNKLNLETINLNFHKVFNDGKSFMGNYSLGESSNHFISLHGYSPLKAGNNGLVAGTNVNFNSENNTRNIQAYLGYNKDFNNLSLEISPTINSTTEAEQTNTNLGLRVSESFPFKLFHPKQNAGIINSSIIGTKSFLNSTTFLVNTDLFNLHSNYTLNLQNGVLPEHKFDFHAVYNPIRKLAVYAGTEIEKNTNENLREFKAGLYFSPMKNTLIDFGYKNEFSNLQPANETSVKSIFGIGIHKIFNAKSVLSLEADLGPNSHLPAQVRAKVNFNLIK